MSEGEPSIQVILADPQEVARIGAREVLEEAGISIVGETGSGEEALHLARDQTPDVLVCEMDLPDLSGIQLAIRLEEAPVEVLALSAYTKERYVRHLMENGLAGYLRKRDAPAYIVEAVRGAARGQDGWLSPGVARKVMKVRQRSDGAALLEECGVTPREREVLNLMVRGLSNREIADALFISKNTVRTHVSRLYEKLGVGSRREAMAWAWEHDLPES